MNYYKSNIFSIFLLIFAIIIFIVVGMFLVKIKKNNTIYEGIVGSSETPAWVIIGTKNNNITPMTGYSMDGINWTTKPLSGVNPSSLNCVACNDTGSLWLIGTNNGLVSSTDGINWTVNSNSTLNAILGSYWNKEKSIWINVGYIRQPTTGWAEASIEYSTNGTSWTKCVNNYGARGLSEFYDVTYNNSISGGTWIAVGRQNTNYYNPIVVFSKDGKNWSQHRQVAYSYNTGGLQNIESLGNNGFIAVGQMTPPVLTSPDGEKWNSNFSLTGTMGMPFDVIYYNNMIILAGYGTNCIAYSSNNGASFTGTITSDSNNKVLYSIASSKDKLIACGYYNNRSVTPNVQSGMLAVSTNGTNWTEQIIPDLSLVTDIASNPNSAAEEEAKKNTAKTEAIAAANAAITAARDAVSVANTGGSSTPEMDAKTAANKAETAAKASLEAANSATTLQAAINAKAAADKAKADADNAKKSAEDAIAASSSARKKEETTRNLDDAISITMKEISSLTEKTEPFVVNSGILSSGTGTDNLFDKFVDFFSPFKEGFTSSDQDLFADVKLKVEKARAILAKIPLTNDNINEALKLSLEALTEARTIRTNLLACNSTPRPTIKFTANTGAFPVASTAPADGSLYWTTEGTKNYLILSKKDASIPAVNVESTLIYCARKDKFIILYDSNIVESRKFIQYKIISSAVTSSHVKYEVVIISNTLNFSKDNITNGQAVYISTNNSQTEIATGDGKTASNPCTDPNSKTFANCKPVCIPTDASGNIIYKEGTKLPDRVVESRNQWMANYYEYRPVRGIRSDGSVQYFPMDPSKTFVGPGTKCIEPCPPTRSKEDTSIRPTYCRPPDPNWGEKPDKDKGEIGKCPTGCIKVDDPTSRQNTSSCTYDKMKGHMCRAVCDLKSDSQCKKNTDCANCEGSDYITQFPVGWKPTVTRTIEEVYSRDDCNNKCKKASINTCHNFLKLEQSGMYLENRCRRIGTSGRKVICGPISNQTQTGLVSGYDLCITCTSNRDMYAYFEYDKKWNPITKQWDFINIREIFYPPFSWFEGDVNSVNNGRGNGAVSGGRDGGGANLRGSKPSWYEEDRDTRDARDSRDMGKIQSGTNSKSISINSASQNAKRQEKSAKVSAMKIQLDKMTNEYNSLEDNVKWNKMQMDKAEKDCYDINVKLRIAIRDYTRAETISIRSGATIKEKSETEAANTRMYTIKQKAREICDNYDSLKDKYMKSVNEMNSLKTKISDLRSKYNTASANIGGGGSGSFLSPIINIFFGDDANRDCSGQLGCGNGIDYSFPSPFNSSVGGKFTPRPFDSGIRL